LTRQSNECSFIAKNITNQQVNYMGYVHVVDVWVDGLLMLGASLMCGDVWVRSVASACFRYANYVGCVTYVCECTTYVHGLVA
jgi:hypothetical protein